MIYTERTLEIQKQHNDAIIQMQLNFQAKQNRLNKIRNYCGVALAGFLAATVAVSAWLFTTVFKIERPSSPGHHRQGLLAGLIKPTDR